MATLGLVDPKEWLSRTKLRFSRTRGPLLVRVDDAYAAYFKLRSDENKRKLHRALDDYLIEKGRNWERVDRNKQSGGLMKYLHEQTRDAPVAKNVLIKRIPEARHGLVYLWQNADVRTQYAKIALEGALSIGSSTAGMLQAASYNPGEKLQGLGVIAKDSAADKVVNVAKHAPKVGALVAAPGGTGVQVPPLHPELHREQRAPVIQLAALRPDPSVLERAKQFFGSAFNSVYAKIRQAIDDIIRDLQFKYRRGGFIGTLGSSVVALTNFILEKVLAHAAPFVGNAIEIAQGIGQSIVAAKERILAYQRRGRFIIAPGHPTQIGHAIETQMNWSIAKGIYNAAKGGAKLAGNLASYGASALIDVIAACVEFAWKFLSRFFEARWMKSWIEELRGLTSNRSDWRADPSDQVWRPRIVYDDQAFTELFERGCEASACVPMMTLNSGISGDQMMFMKMFDDTGGLLGQGSGTSSLGDKPSAAAQKQFDAATAYWTQLKEWGRNYLEATGFTFTSTDPVARGLMWHAIQHHQGGPMSTGDKVLSFLAGS